MSRVDNAVLKISRRRLPKSFGAFLQQNRTASSIRPRNTAMCLTTISDVTWRRLMHSWRKPRIRRRLCFFLFFTEKESFFEFSKLPSTVLAIGCKSFYAKRVSLNFRRFSVRDASSFIFSYRESFSEFLFFFFRICHWMRVRDAFFKSFYTKKVPLNFVSFFYLLQKLDILSEYIFFTSLCYL